MSTDAIETLATDPRLKPLIEEHGPLTVEPAEDTFRRLVVAIVRQQVSMASARAIRERLFERFDVEPATIASATPAELREVGLSRQKADYVQNVAEAYLERGYDHAYFTGMADEAVVAELTDIPGVGPWTARMFLMFCLGRADVFPVEDLGIRKGMRLLFDEELTRSDMVDRAEAWRPYRSYASRYVWRAYE